MGGLSKIVKPEAVPLQGYAYPNLSKKTIIKILLNCPLSTESLM
jgi:hypothetical protein